MLSFFLVKLLYRYKSVSQETSLEKSQRHHRGNRWDRKLGAVLSLKRSLVGNVYLMTE